MISTTDVFRFNETPEKGLFVPLFFFFNHVPRDEIYVNANAVCSKFRHLRHAC